jgi:phosphohistidine phosphatase
MILYIVRHAWATHPDDPGYPDDSQRPLTKEGRKRFANVVEKLAQRGFHPQVILTSPLLRCLQTAELIAAGLPGKREIVQRAELEPGSHLEELLQWMNHELVKYEEIAWVGHNPDVSQMTAALVGAGPDALDFSKGAVAAIRFEDPPANGTGVLHWLVTAKILGC